MEGIVYFQCNDWTPYPKAAAHFIYDYLEGNFHSNNNDAVLKTGEDIEKWLIDNELCILCDSYDMSIQYWVTCKKEWLENNFPELLPFAKEEPEDGTYKGDRKFFLKHCPENYGVQFIYTDESEEYEKYKERFVEFKED